MPEGHTLRLHARRLQPLVGHAVAVETPQARHRFAGIAEAVDGRVLEKVWAHGKHLLLRFEGGRVLHNHLRMQGTWAVYREEEPARGPASSAWLTLRASGLVAVQRNGPVLELLEARTLGRHPVLARLGPDLLGDGFDAAAATARARASCPPGTAIADVLLDQRVACGLGNMFKCEALFALGIDPWTPLATVDDEALTAVYAEGARQLAASVAAGRELPRRVYGRPACPRCRGRIRRLAQGDDGRVTHWCPRCQPASVTLPQAPAAAR